MAAGSPSEKHYLPEDAIDNNIRKKHSAVQAVARTRLANVNPGNVIDYNWIKADILNFMERFNVKEIAFDRWNSSQLVNDLMEVNAPMVAFVWLRIHERPHERAGAPLSGERNTTPQ